MQIYRVLYVLIAVLSVSLPVEVQASVLGDVAVSGVEQVSIPKVYTETKVGLFQEEVHHLGGQLEEFKSQNLKLNEQLAATKVMQLTLRGQENAQIKMLMSQLEDRPMTFEVWAGLLLGASGLIMTALGVGIAIFAFYGYRELLNTVKKTAHDIGGEVASKLAKEVAEEVTIKISKEIIEKQIETGGFDMSIRTAVNQYIYRGVNMGDDDANNSSPTEGEEAS